MTPSRIFHSLPEPLEGEDHKTYFMRLKDASTDIGLMELAEQTRLKIRQRDIKSLVARISEGEDVVAMREAIVILLKEVYHL